MCMKTNKAATFCQPKMRTFLFNLWECSDNLYKPLPILREAGAFLSRVGIGLTRSLVHMEDFLRNLFNLHRDGLSMHDLACQRGMRCPKASLPYHQSEHACSAGVPTRGESTFPLRDMNFHCPSEPCVSIVDARWGRALRRCCLGEQYRPYR
jgi:hypothetical protein